MKKFYLSLVAMLLTCFSAFATNYKIDEPKALTADAIAFDVVDPDVSEAEIWNIYQNEDYKLHIDIVKNLPLDPTRTYTLEDMEVSYSYIYDKNEIVVASNGGKNWKRYEFTSISVKVGENNELEAVLEAKNGEDVISGTFVFNNPDPITVTLEGETEYIADIPVYAVSAKNAGSALKADYSVQFGIKEASYESKTTFTKDDLMANGNTIRVATVETKITDANITLTVGAESQTFEGTVVGADGKNYAICVTTNIPSKEAKKETVDFGAVLEVSEDEGDIKLVAQNEESKFVGYITVSPVTTDVPSGEYTLLSYTKYGKNSDFGYMLDAVEDGKVTVTNNEGEISIVVTFKQNNVEYTVNAKTAPAPELLTVAIEEGEGVYTVTSTSATAALYYLCKPMSWLDEGETPESAALAEIAGMGSMIDSEETWDLYDHMGLKPAPKTFTVADYQEMYAGQEMFIIAANVGWDGEKLGFISNIAQQNFTVTEAEPLVITKPRSWNFTDGSAITIGNDNWGAVDSKGRTALQVDLSDQELPNSKFEGIYFTVAKSAVYGISNNYCLQSGSMTVRIPNCGAGDIIAIEFAGAGSEATVTSDNIVEGVSTTVTKAGTTQNVTVVENGDVVLVMKCSKGFRLYNISVTPADPTAINNAVVAPKAVSVKAMVNGKLVIIKNGVKYNAFGVKM